MTITIRLDRKFMLAACTFFAALAALTLAWHPATATQVAAQATVQATPATPCPPAVGEPRISTAAIQRMEHGLMVWVGDKRQIYVMYYAPGSETNGTVEVFPENWEEGMPDSDPSLQAPVGMAQPSRGFGKLWRENAQVKDALGWGTDIQRGYMTVITTQGDQTWFNVRDNGFKIVGNKWEDIYFWRK